MRRKRATVATPDEWQCGVRRLAVANGPNIFQMLLVTVINVTETVILARQQTHKYCLYGLTARFWSFQGPWCRVNKIMKK